MAAKKQTGAKAAVKAAAKGDPSKAETVTHEESGVGGVDASQEVRAGLATGSNAGKEDQPDSLVIDTTIVPSSPDEKTTADLSVVVTEDGKKGPAAS